MIFRTGDKTFRVSRVMKKPIFVVSDQVQLKPGCTTTEEALISRFWKKRNCTNYVAKIKAPLFFAYAKRDFLMMRLKCKYIFSVFRMHHTNISV